MQLTLYSSIAWRHPFGIGQVLDWAKQFGWDAIDARGLNLDVPGDVDQRINAFGYDMLDPRQIRPSARRDLRRRIEDSGKPLLGIYCASSVNLPGATGDPYRELFREYLQLAADLGAQWIRSINNTCRSLGPTEMSPAEAYDRTVAGLHDVGRTARDLNVGLLLENNENTVPSDAAGLLRLKQDVGNVCRVGIAYDPVNLYFQGGDPIAGLEMLAGQIDILHLKNVCRHRDARWDYLPRGDFSYEWTALADGDLNWRALLHQAVQQGFGGPLVFEYVNPFKGMPLAYWNQLREPDEAARIEAEYLREILGGNHA